MMKKKKFTFKTEKSTGPYGSFYPDHHYIKLDKKIVGNISDRDFQISLMVYKDDIMEDGNPNRAWKWVRFKHKSESLELVKTFLNDNIDLILEKYRLHSLDQ